MDPITHAALGAATAQLALCNFNRRIPWIVGGLAALTPDLDIFIHQPNLTLSLEYWHRHFTHALIFIPLGALCVTLLLMFIPFFRKNWKITFAAALIGYASHGLLDGMTSYGTLLYWPFSYQRISWDIIAIVDPFITIPLVLGIVWYLIHHKKIGITTGFISIFIVLGLNFIQHYRAIEIVKLYSAEHELNFSRIRAIPYLASSRYWRIVAIQDQYLWVGEAYTPFGGQSTLKKLQLLPILTNKIPSKHLTENQQREQSIFTWFSDDYVVYLGDSRCLVDGRYLMGENPMYALWGIQLGKDGHTTKLRNIKTETKCLE